jgi:hypothetical protein
MGRIQSATPISPLFRTGARPGGRRRALRERPAAGLLGLIGWAALLGVLGSVFLICAGAAGAPNTFVPARSGGWPGWLAGPLSGLGMRLTDTRFQVFTIALCASFALLLVAARSLPLRAIAATIVLAHVILLLGPPLLSQDVFGYLAFARMGALHGLDPYTRLPSEAPTDAVFGFIGWPFQHSPYGPLFTLASYAAAPLGAAGGLWAFKAVAVLSSLAGVALISQAAAMLGHSRRFAAVFVGANPVLLLMAVGGAHNDTLILLALGVALVLSAAARPAMRAAAVAVAGGVGVKLTAGLLLPFLALAPARSRERAGVAVAGGLGLLVVAVVGLAGFGVHAVGFLGAVGEQQQLIATHSIPAETARLAGLAGVPAWWRDLFAGLFVVVAALCLRASARGGDWRTAAGWCTLALLLCTAWLLPWYGLWLLPLAAVSGDRRLRGATLAFCAYAVLIHLSLADPLLSPRPPHPSRHLPFPVPGARNRLELAGFQILRDAQLYLRW